MTSPAQRIGVFVCDCGLNIAGTVDTEEVSRFAKTLPGVAAVVRNPMRGFFFGPGLSDSSMRSMDPKR